MNLAHYIIFHPDYQREKATAKAWAITDGQLNKNWEGEIHVDQIDCGNEDPFVHHDPWLYSYCHASQLRKKVRKDSYLQPGSKLFFVSGDQANDNVLAFDTVFLIGAVQEWHRDKGLQLPENYQSHYQNSKSELWQRHFKYPFQKIHEGVTHTFEAKLWENDKADFSFLPLAEECRKVTVQFSELPNALRTKIKAKVHGKHPVLLSDEEMLVISAAIEKKVKIKVIRNIKVDRTKNAGATSSSCGKGSGHARGHKRC